MRFTSIALLYSASAIALAPPAIAQESANGPATTASEENIIIVQARRRDEAVQDVPAVIQTVTADAAGRLNIRDFKEVSTLVPGLQLTTEGNGIGGGAQLRGINFDINASGNNPTVEFYFNDAPISAGAILQQMYDIGQIEVQRGPQGTLRGRASPSGAITVGAKKPDLYSYGGTADMTANDIGTLNFKGALNIPVIEGIAALRVAGVWDENEVDRVRPIAASRDPFSRTKSGRVSGLVQPADWLKLEGLYQHLDRRAYTYDQAASFSEASDDAAPSPVFISSADRRSIQESARPIHQTFDIYNWRSEVSLLGQVLIYQGSHYTQKLESATNQDFGNFFADDINQETVTHAKSTSHEVRLQNDGRVLGMFDYVVGYFDYKNDSPTDLNSPTVIGLPLSATSGYAVAVVQTPISRIGTSHERSAFGNVTAHFGESTELSGGVRHINYKAQNYLYVNDALLTSDSQDASKWIYSASLKHNFTRDFMVYASTGSSWRPGLTAVGDFSTQPSALEQSFVTLNPETSKSYEVGLKSTLLDGRMHANLTAYHQDFKNYPYRVGGNGIYYVKYSYYDNFGNVPSVAQFNFVAAVPVKVNGIEGDVSYQFDDHLSFSLLASYALGKIRKGSIPCTDINGDGIPDNTSSAPSLQELLAATGGNNLSSCIVSQRSSYMPPFSATVQGEYRRPISSKVDGYLRGLLNFKGASQTDPTISYDDVGAYALANIYLGIRDPAGAWEVSLFAKNLGKTQTIARTTPLSTTYLRYPTYASTTFTSTYTGVTTTPPREFGINVRYAFGSR